MKTKNKLKLKDFIEVLKLANFNEVVVIFIKEKSGNIRPVYGGNLIEKNVYAYLLNCYVLDSYLGTGDSFIIQIEEDSSEI